MKYERNTDLQALINEVPQLLTDEGYVKSIYKDSLGYLTFGVGTLITPEMPEYGLPAGTPVSEARCAEAFFHELVHKTLGEGPKVFGDEWYGFPMDAKQVFTNMSYNLGRTRLSKFKKMIAAAKRHDWTEASIQLLDSRYARQVKGRADRLSKRLIALG